MNQAIRAGFERYMSPNCAPAEIIPVRDRDSRQWHSKDREYLDLANGSAAPAPGQAHPAQLRQRPAPGAPRLPVNALSDDVLCTWPPACCLINPILKGP